jgi:hypothetical protein
MNGGQLSLTLREYDASWKGRDGKSGAAFIFHRPGGAWTKPQGQTTLKMYYFQ